MFETWGNSEIPLPKELAPNDEKLWGYVHVQLQVAWFYVEIESETEGLKLSSAYLLSSIAQIQSLANDSDVVIMAAHVVVPKHLNQGECWKMYRLKRIMSGIKKRGTRRSKSTLFQLHEDGRIIHDPPLHPNEALENVEVLLEF